MTKIEKFVKACISKFKLLSIATAVIVVAGLVCMFVFGYSTNATNYDMTTLSVKMNKYAYSQYLDEIEGVANDFFSENNLKYEYDMNAEMHGDESEIVYVFDKGVVFTDAMLANLQATFDALTATDSNHALAGSVINVDVNTEVALDRLPANGLLRTVIAGAAFAVLACLYVTIRHHYTSGLTMFVSLGVGAALTSALVLLTRMPITGNLLYTLFFNLLFTAICTMFTLNKVRAAQKGDKNVDAETLIKSSLAVGQVLTFAVACVVALVLVGAIATSAVRWFAAISLLSVVAGVFASLFFAPALYLIVKKLADEKDAQRARYDYKRS
ncbi:MAG: hypothetical protein IKA72_02075 [Clostridia bacterium]|nr:hypothetical protein [Clostridia bacterium]